jgi:hypothetical protein
VVQRLFVADVTNNNHQLNSAKNAAQILFRFTNVFADNAGEIDLVKVQVAAHDSIEFSVI